MKIPLSPRGTTCSVPGQKQEAALCWSESPPGSRRVACTDRKGPTKVVSGLSYSSKAPKDSRKHDVPECIGGRSKRGVAAEIDQFRLDTGTT